MIAELVFGGKKIGDYVLTLQEIMGIRTGVDWERDVESRLFGEVQALHLMASKPELLLLSSMARASYVQYIVNNREKYGPKADDWVHLAMSSKVMVLTIGGAKLTIADMPPNMSGAYRVMSSINPTGVEKIRTQA